MANMEDEGQNLALNPVDPSTRLKPDLASAAVAKKVHPQQTQFEEDSALSKAEKYERHGNVYDVDKLPSKRIKLDPDAGPGQEDQALNRSERRKGVAPIKAEFIMHPPGSKGDRSATVPDDDAAEGSHHVEQLNGSKGGRKREKSKGQNANRSFGTSRDEVGLCQSRAYSPEFHPDACRYGDDCKFEHDLRKYLKQWKREDLTTFGGICPIWAAKGKCQAGWKCRFVGSHMEERETEDGRKELVLLEEKSKIGHLEMPAKHSSDIEILNIISTQDKADLMKRRVKTPKADEYNEWLVKSSKGVDQASQRGPRKDGKFDTLDADKTNVIEGRDIMGDNRAQYIEAPFLPSEKRRIYFGPETPVLAPLTTQGNLPFRRLCVGLGAQITYSEMAVGLPLIQGQKSEWALMRAHESEVASPAYEPKGPTVLDYNNAEDIRFGAQIAANKPWQALKTTEVLSKLCPYLRVIDLNCGCPIDLICRTGAGSALLDSQSKLEKMIRGMNVVSGEIPITVKIRTGTKDNRPTAHKLVERLVYGGHEASELGAGSSGVAAITLHGRSKQQRYTKNANWEYISDCAALIERFNEKGDDLSDTIKEVERRILPANGRVYFIGNGDCYSHIDYNTHLAEAKVDSVMIARGALIKPWIFEEIEQGQYIDKSATERLALIERYVRYGLETWGSDEMGIGTTRRFLLEWLSFAYRYVPVGILEHLPPNLQDRPPAWRGRNDLETLLGSDNYQDWIKISEMFLGPAHKDFHFEPKHKSNSYELGAEG